MRRYAALTMAATDFTAWTSRNGYALSTETREVVRHAEHLTSDLIELRLRLRKGVNASKPTVRVRFGGIVPTLPLRSIAADVADTMRLSVMVISYASAQAASFRTETFDEGAIPAARATGTRLPWSRACRLLPIHVSPPPTLRGTTKVTTCKVEELLEFAREGRLRIPDFQRPLRWKASDVIALYESIVRGYPVGSLLFASREAPAQRVKLGAFELDAPQRSDAYIVVDGQQRIAAIVGALLHPGEAPSGDVYAIWYDLETETFFRLMRGTAPVTAMPLCAFDTPDRTLAWVHGWALGKERADLVQKAFRVSTQVRNFAVACAIVSGSDDQPLREIFRRVNNTGVAMRAHEVFNALHGRGDASPTLAVARRLSEFGFGVLPQDFILRCAAFVEGVDAGKGIDDFRSKHGLEHTEAALRRSFEFLVADALIPHIKLLPYRIVLQVLARYFALHPSPSRRARTLLRRWVWRSIASRAKSSSLTRERELQSVVEQPDAEYAAQALLRDPALGDPIPLKTLLDPWNPRGAASQIFTLALLSRAPRDPRDLERFDLDKAQSALAQEHDPDNNTREASASDLVLDLGGRASKSSTLAARVLVRDHDALEALRTAAPEVLDEHVIAPDAADALRAWAGGRGKIETFEAIRAPTLDAWIKRFLEERCGHGESDRVSIRAIQDMVARVVEGA